MIDVDDRVAHPRCLVEDVAAAVEVYAGHLISNGRRSAQLPAFAGVALNDLQRLVGGPCSSAVRPMPGGRTPGPRGCKPIHLLGDDVAAEVARLRAGGVGLRVDIAIDDWSSNPIEPLIRGGAR